MHYGEEGVIISSQWCYVIYEQTLIIKYKFVFVLQEGQCISVISFGNQASDANDPDLLDCPIWILVINIVAMEMLRAKLPPAPVRLPTGTQSTYM